MPFSSLLREAALDALAVLLPVDCAGCGSRDRALCAACRLALQQPLESRMLGSGLPVVSALAYEGSVRSALLQLKEYGRTDVARAFAAPLGTAILAAAGLAGAPVELAPVPSSRASRRRRGYDPVDTLLRATPYGPQRRVLTVTSPRLTQKALGRDDRALNATGSLRAVRSLAGRSFVIVDDVLTTGATLEEAARALREAGAEVAAAATLAQTRRRLGVDQALPAYLRQMS